MCLKIYKTFTFSNNNAFLRAIDRVEKYDFPPNRFEVTVVEEEIEDRETKSYKEMQELSSAFTRVLIRPTWSEFRSVVDEMKDKDVFGKVIMEER